MREGIHRTAGTGYSGYNFCTDMHSFSLTMIIQRSMQLVQCIVLFWANNMTECIIPRKRNEFYQK